MKPSDASTYLDTLFFALLVLALLALRRVHNWKKRTRGRPLPPGPEPLPIVGNALDMPKIKPWLGFRDLRRQYGDLVYLRVFGQHLIVIGKAELAFEFLEKRSASTSDRPLNPVVDLSGQGSNFALMPYGRRWRRHRRMLWQHFNHGTISKYQSIQRAKTYVFLAQLMQSPSRLEGHIQYLFSTVMLKLLYGIDASGEDDERIRIMDIAIESIRQASPGEFAVEMLPFLRYVPSWLPGAGYQKLFAACKRANENLRHGLFDEVKSRLHDKTPVSSCVARDLLAATKIAAEGKREDIENDEVVSKNVCAVAFQAGADTTFSTLHALFVALALHPDVQKKAQAELDAVVGPSRLPDYVDMDALAYVNAVAKEALRWHTVGPLSVPHRTIEDEELCGYFIPAGTNVITNLWEMLHDPEVYDEPHEFRPERFLHDGKLDTNVRDPTSIVFGFGRRRVLIRICPGRHFAQASLFIAVASVLHVFDIGLPLDSDGRPIQIQYEQSHGLISYPVDGRCSVNLRSAAAKTLILDAQERLGVITEDNS
ncbi:CyP450 monooxygenase [Trametes meyenii]|nr:CyP450 monooxygenase [Trametes meyenii]